jgi:hypothetical protein
VLARSSFWSTMNYRSVMVFGRARLVDDADEVRTALEAIVEHVAPGRSLEVREPTPLEIKATKVLALRIDTASAKVRTGDPEDDPADLDSTVWAGVVPLGARFGDPVPASNLAPDLAVPESVRRLFR